MFKSLTFILAYPELGLYVRKSADQFIVTTNTWQKLNNWIVASDLIGAYNYDAQLINQEHVIAPITGIYYTTTSIPIENGLPGTEIQLALVNGDDTNENDFSLLSRQQVITGGKITISVNGFIKVYAGQKITVQVKGEAQFKTTVKSHFSLHFIGPTGAVPAYLAQVDSDISFNNGSIIAPFITEGRAKLYRSLSGLCSIKCVY